MNKLDIGDLFIFNFMRNELYYVVDVTNEDIYTQAILSNEKIDFVKKCLYEDMENNLLLVIKHE